MNKLKTILATVLLGVTAILLLPIANAGNKVEVCHLPPGNPSNFHTISVNQNALQAHLNHGDVEGSCADNGPILCDDGDICTVDAFEPGTEICQVDEPVDCSDGDPKTDDSCNSAQGCVNTPIPPDIACDDDNACTLNEYVDIDSRPLMCTNAGVVNCDDGDPTTRDSCDMVTGCANDPILGELAEVTAQSQNVTLVDESPVIITLVGAASAIMSGESLNFSIASGPANGTLSGLANVIPPTENLCSLERTTCTVNADCPTGETCDPSTPPSTTATVTYTPGAIPPTPPADDGFDFQVEFEGIDATATVSIFGPAVDDGTAPGFDEITAFAKSVQLKVGDSVVITVKAGAPNGVGDLTFTTSSGPNQGTLTAPVPRISPVRTAQVTYDHTAGVPGSDAFDFTACDAAAPTVCATATVSLDIDEAQELADDKELSGDLNQPIPFSIP